MFFGLEKCCTFASAFEKETDRERDKAIFEEIKINEQK